MKRCFPVALFWLASFFPAIDANAAPIELLLRRQVETSPGSGRYHAIESASTWNGAETAVVVCDMWDDHWCKGAAARVAEMAPRMNELLKAAREKGALIIHAPSDCMKFYEGTAARKRAQDAPAAPTAAPIGRWRALDAKREGALPIDDSDGGCDCEPRCKEGRPWKRQIAVLEIDDADAIADDAQAYYLMRSRGVKNVIVMGVHTNMCVLGRPFAIREMIVQGMNVALVRDMTDTMYNHRRRPEVSHFSGTDLVVEHIERHWAPSVSSASLTGKAEFRFAADRRPTVAVVMAEDEYKTERTLTEFANSHLRKAYRLSLIYGSDKDRDDIPGLEALGAADVLLLSVRRRTLPPEQLDRFRKHVAAGKGVVGIRTASHAFSPPLGKSVPEGQAAWPEFDRDILGGSYMGHYGSGADVGPTQVTFAREGAGHEILAGIAKREHLAGSSLYKTRPLAKTTTLLAVGMAKGAAAPEPVAWTNLAGRSRVFYTSLGHEDDFKQEYFQRLLENGVRWAAKRN